MATKKDPVSLALDTFQELRSAGALGVWDMQGKHLMRRPDPNAVRRAIEEVALESYRLGVEAGQHAAAMTAEAAKALAQDQTPPAPATPRTSTPESRIATKKSAPAKKSTQKAAKKGKKKAAKKTGKKAAKKAAKSAKKSAEKGVRKTGKKAKKK